VPEQTIVRVPSRAWHGDIEQELGFPSAWKVEMKGPADAPAMTAEEIQAAFSRPIGTPPLRELARGRSDAVIIVDDLSRPTPAAEILPVVLEELRSAGLPDRKIQFVVGGGSHRPITESEMAQKLGKDVAGQYRVSNHDFMAGDLVGMGSLPTGMPIYINRIVAGADLKICLGGIYPHGAVGFGGGAKLIVPGVSGFATGYYFHTFSAARGHGLVEGRDGTPDHRDYAEQVARVLGVDAMVNVVINSRRQVAGLFVGDIVQAHRAGARFAKSVYGTALTEEYAREIDLVVTNCYPLDGDALQISKCLWVRRHFQGAYCVAVNPACDGNCYHGLYQRIDWARFQAERAAQTPTPDPEPFVKDADQLLVWSEGYEAGDFADRVPNGILYRSWQTLISQLKTVLPAQARVAVFPCGGIQVPADTGPVKKKGP
jgi:nickel-dependent lactate racemase